MTPIQFSQPLFVRSRHYPVIWKGKLFTHNQHFPWQEMGTPQDVVMTLYNQDRLYHNPELEEQTKVGDRLAELSGEPLKKLVRLTNAFVKQRCTTDKEFQAKKIKQSTIEDKQRGLIRSWIHRNEWALDEYYRIRDEVLETKEATEV